MTGTQFLSPHHDAPTAGFFDIPDQGQSVSWEVAPPLQAAWARATEHFKVQIQEFHTPAWIPGSDLGQVTLSLFSPHFLLI